MGSLREQSRTPAALAAAAALDNADIGSGEESLIILQSLLCMMREKNLLTRADMEELCHKVELRAKGDLDNPIPCCAERATAASSTMQRITNYMGQRYGGKHSRVFR